VSLLLGNGGGTFSAAESFAVGAGTSAAVTDGDFNSDGQVDAADYVVWRKNGGSVNEYDAWRATFGVHWVLTTRAILKAEYLHNGEYLGHGVGQIPNDVFTSSLVMSF